MKSINDQVKFWIGHCMRSAAKELDQQAIDFVGHAAELRAMAPAVQKSPPGGQAQG